MAWQTEVQYQIESYQRLKKCYLIPSLLNTQNYKVRIKGKLEQSKERCSALPYTAIEKEPSTKVTKYTITLF